MEVRDAQHLKYNLNHEENLLYAAWNAAATQDEGVIVCLNTGHVEFAGKPIFFEIPCGRFACTEDNPILTLSYYPPHTITLPPGSDESPRMHVFIRAQHTITERTLQQLGLAVYARMMPLQWMDMYTASTKHLTTITLRYGGRESASENAEEGETSSAERATEAATEAATGAAEEAAVTAEEAAVTAEEAAVEASEDFWACGMTAL
jgi:hypothetical protein